MKPSLFAGACLSVLAAFAAAPALAGDDTGAQISGAIARRHMLQTIFGKCAATFPASKADFDGQFESWRKDNADLLAAADQALAAMTADQQAVLDRALAPVVDAVGTIYAQAAKEDGGQKKFCNDAVASFGAAADSGYFDADNYEEAAGMYAQSMWFAEALAPLCTARFPATSAELEAAQAAWRSRDGAIQAQVLSASGEWKKSDPKAYDAMRAATFAQARSGFDALLKVGEENASAFCHQHFAEMASGEKRRQSPKMFEFLEQGGKAH